MEDGGQTSGQTPAPEGFETWNDYWTAQGMPWRTEPVIDEERQAYLAERRQVKPDIEKGTYPFRDETGSIKLDRADVEWLLATHESGGVRGPVSWNDLSQWLREGLDLRGADLRGVDLGGVYPVGMPLTRLRAGLTTAEWQGATPEQRTAAAVRFEGARLVEAHLEWARLRDGRCEGADLRRAWLQGAHAQGIHLRGANLRRAVLEGADLSEAHFEGGYLRPEHLESVRSILPAFRDSLPAADLRSAFFDAHSTLRDATLGDKAWGWVTVADVRWNGVSLATQGWKRVMQLGDEQTPRRREAAPEARKDRQALQREFAAAARANQQVATVLRAQGITDDADRFAYRAQLCQGQLLRLQKRWGQWAFLGMLWLLSGYGYRIGRIFGAYLAVLVAFACIYFALGLPNTHGATAPTLVGDSFLVSLTAIHGRVFLEQLGQYSVQAWVAAVESVVGIVIEGVFVAMLVQRFFGGR